MTILYIIPRYYPGGAERLVLEYAAHFDSKQYDIHVASCVDEGQLLPEFAQTSAKLFVGSKARQGSRRVIWKELKKYISDVQPDIIHTHLLSGDFAGYLAKKAFPKIKWISTQHNVEHKRPYIYRMIWKYILRKTDRVIAVSPAVERYAKQAFNIHSEKITMIPNGIDLSHWKNLNTDFLFDTTPYQLASIGRLEEQKGHTYIIDALGKLKKHRWEYHIFGDGSFQQKLLLQAKKLHIADRINFHGNVDDLPKRLEKIDLVIQPSLWEGMSLTVMEAMAAGRPVLATNVAAECLIEDEHTGYVVPSKDVGALQQAIANILSNIDVAKRVAKQGRKHAFLQFGIEKHIRVVKDVYMEATSKL
jgi:glycosyltransferase involved in cell wall biosynthesis